MKCLSIKPYWLSKILLKEKTIETRKWSTKYRGDIVLVSSKSNSTNCLRGYALCIIELYDVTTFKKEHLQQSCLSEYSPNLFSWHIRNIRYIKPIQLKGQLRLYERDIHPIILNNVDIYSEYNINV